MVAVANGELTKAEVLGHKEFWNIPYRRYILKIGFLKVPGLCCNN